MDVCEATVANTWSPSTAAVTSVAHVLGEPLRQSVAADFFVVPTATGRLLFVLVILAHEWQWRRIGSRRGDRASNSGVDRSTATRSVPVRDRDHAFGGWADTAKAMEIDEVLTAPRSPWQKLRAITSRSSKRCC
jgi:hypothetical protein